MSRGLCAALAVLLLAGRVAAGPDAPPLTADGAAKAVAKAWQEKDEGQVKALAAQDDPDPWAVADALLVLGAKEAAEAFAKAAPRKDVERLPAFVAAWGASAHDKAAREAIAKGNAALGAKRFAEALEAFSAAPAEAAAFLRLRCAYGAGLALGALGRPAEAADRFCATATEAETLGWLARASASLKECIRSDAAAGRLPKATETAKRLLVLETARSTRAGLALAHVLSGRVAVEALRWDDAHAAYTAALKAFREIGDSAREAATLNDLAWASRGRKKLADIEDAVTASLAISELAGFSAEAARSHEILATVHVDLGRLNGAVDEYREALPHARKAGDAAMAARVQFLIGRYLGDLGDHEEALEPLKASAEGFEALGPERRDGATSVRARWAWSLAALGKADEARPHVERAAAAAKSSKSPLVQGAVLRARARLLRAEGKVAEAVAAYREAAAPLEAAQETTDAVLVLVEIAETQREAKDLPEARKTADAAVASARKQRDRFSVPVAIAAAASVRKDQGEAKEALELARHALKAFQDNRHVRGINAMSAMVSELEAAAGPR